MGVYSTQLYKLLPQYARFLDDRGILRHFCEAIQPEIDQLYGIVRNQARYYDPQLTDDRFLDFLQQFVGGGIQDGKWLGIGLNPDWPSWYKRQVIPDLWQYWQIKGTERGVRQAINLWLQLEQAKTSSVYIRLPLSKFPTEAPNSWFAWGDCYDSHLFQDYEDRLFFGAGDAPGVEHRPDYLTVRNTSWLWEWGDIVPDSGNDIAPLPITTKLAQWDAPRSSPVSEPYPVDFGIEWSDRTLSCFLAPLINDESSHLGARRPWQHLFLNEFDWNKTFPDIIDLNPEIYPALAVPTTFGWLEDIRSIKPLILIEQDDAPQYRISTEIEIDGMQYGVLDEASSKIPGSVTGSFLYKSIPPSYARNYPDYDPIYEAGDWWPFPVVDPYYTTEYKEITAEFGVWIPDYWDGMWWASAIAPWEQGIATPLLEVPTFGSTGSDDQENGYISAIVYEDNQDNSSQVTDLIYQSAEVKSSTNNPNDQYLPGWVTEISDTQGDFIEAVVVDSTQIIDLNYQSAEVYKLADATEFNNLDEPYLLGLVTDLVIIKDEFIEAVVVDSTEIIDSNYQLAEVTGSDNNLDDQYLPGLIIDRRDYLEALVIDSPQLTDLNYQSAEVKNIGNNINNQYLPGLITEKESYSEALIIDERVYLTYQPAKIEDTEYYPTVGYESASVIDSAVEEYRLYSIQVPFIDLSDFNIADSLNRPPGEWWYLAWDTYKHKESIEVFHAGSGCNLGIEIELDDFEIPVIDLGVFEEGTNQLLRGEPPQLELPVKIAEYISPYSEGWEYYRQSEQGLGLIYENIPLPIDIYAIDIDILLDVPVVDRERVQLCNVFKRWSTGEILRWEEYKEEIPAPERDLFEIYPLLAKASRLENWRAVVETNSEIYLIEPVAGFWRNTQTIRGEEEYFLSEHLGRRFYGKTRSQSFSFEDKMTNLHLEFVFRPKRGETVRSLTLWLDDQQVHSQFFYDSLNFPVEACYGFKFFLPFTLPTGATNPDDNLAILDILPGLRDRLVKLQQLAIAPQVITQELQEEIKTVYEQPVTVEGLRTTMTQIQGTLDKLLASPNLGDLHHVEILKSPTLQVTIRHGLGKEPAVTFTADDGFDAEIEVYRPLDANTVRVTFTKPAQGRLFFN